MLCTFLSSQNGEFTVKIAEIFNPKMEKYSYLVHETGYRTNCQMSAIKNARAYLKKKRKNNEIVSDVKKKRIKRKRKYNK
jgi:hypothetical protein